MGEPKSNRKRILTGDRPTGKLHLGHYVGSLLNRLKLQKEYETYILIADVQALTTHWERPEMLRQAVLDVAMDNLAVGVGPSFDQQDDPEKATLCIQSMIPEIAELTSIYGLFTNMNKLRHNPTTKAEALQHGYIRPRPALYVQLFTEREVDDATLAAARQQLKRNLDASSIDIRLPLRELEGTLNHNGYSVSEETVGFGAGYVDPSSISVVWVFENEMGSRQMEEIAQELEPDLRPLDISNRDIQLNFDVLIERVKQLCQKHGYPVVHQYVDLVRTPEDTVGIHGFDQLKYGFFGYPLSQAADITFVQANLVPVGEDQKPHVELTRDVVSKFNQLYGGGEVIIPMPEPLIGDVPRLAGLDGDTKMSKSLGNVINLADPPHAVREAVWKAVTDPAKIRMNDVGHPEICNVYKYHKVFNKPQVAKIERDCQKPGELRCVYCKEMLTDVLNDLLAPIRERRIPFEEHPERVWQILRDGTKKAREEGAKTLARVKKAMKLDYF